MRRRGKTIVFFLLCLPLFTAVFCACDAFGQDERVHLHAFGPWKETPATCEEDGERVRSCPCGVSQSEIIPAAGHSPEPFSVEATCVKDGFRCMKCSVCGAMEEIEVIPAAHLWQVERVIEEETCTEDGSLVEKCGRCKAERTVSIPASGHKWSAVEVFREATCEEDGLRCAVCETCGAREQEQIIPKNGHAFGQWHTEEQPSCERAGSAKRTCSSCGAEESKPLPQTGHRYADTFTVDEEPSIGHEGTMSKHCLNPGCGSRSEVTPIEALKDETAFTVSLCNSSGERLSGDVPPKIAIYDGDVPVMEECAFRIAVTLPTKEYRVAVSGVPKGYIASEEYILSPASPNLEIRLPAHLIMEAPPSDLKYTVGSVMYDMTVQVVELEKKDDRTISLHDLFTQYKAVLINMYFTTCPACVSEMPAFVQAYNTPTEAGTLYGEEVACVMLDAEPYDPNTETVERIRNFKRRTNYYLGSYGGATDIPMIVIHDVWLRAYFARAISNGTYPTSILVDCEGVILRSVTGAMSKQAFLSWMQQGIDRYNAICAWREGEGLGAMHEDESAALLSRVLAEGFVVRRRRP